jgi:NAD(P)-dependent dehydrogenase (short-subunit alcohol dehydrogenase family)
MASVRDAGCSAGGSRDVVGAGSGIGKETAHRLVKEGAHNVCVDLNKDAAEATA